MKPPNIHMMQHSQDLKLAQVKIHKLTQYSVSLKLQMKQVKVFTERVDLVTQSMM